MTRPPPVLTDDADDAPIRHDINSEDIRRTYPDLPVGGDRNSFVSLCDYLAYKTIRHLFPDFRPQCIHDPDFRPQCIHDPATPPKPTSVAPLFNKLFAQPLPTNRVVVGKEHK